MRWSGTGAFVARSFSTIDARTDSSLSPSTCTSLVLYLLCLLPFISLRKRKLTQWSPSMSPSFPRDLTRLLHTFCGVPAGQFDDQCYSAGLNKTVFVNWCLTVRWGL